MNDLPWRMTIVIGVVVIFVFGMIYFLLFWSLEILTALICQGPCVTTTTLG